MRLLPKPFLAVAAVGTVIFGVLGALPWLTARRLDATCSKTAPDRNCVLAMRYLADGWSLSGEMARAKPWYERAATAGDAAAMFELGWLYHQAAVEDRRRYRTMFHLADAVQPWPPNPPNGVLDPEAVEHALPGAAADDDEQAQLLAHESMKWLAAQRDDAREAAEWYSRAADHQFAPAMNNLGEVYREGLIQSPDFDEAFHWYQAAAAAGNPIGLWNVGAAYASGQGTPRNQSVADQWSTWRPTANGVAPDLDEPVLQRTTLHGAEMSEERRDALRAAARAGTPYSVTITWTAAK
jgi:TPR repeat protein